MQNEERARSAVVRGSVEELEWSDDGGQGYAVIPQIKRRPTLDWVGSGRKRLCLSGSGWALEEDRLFARLSECAQMSTLTADVCSDV